MNRRRTVVALVCASSAVISWWALPQQVAVRRVALLSPLSSTDPENRSRLAVFEQELQKLGWQRGANLLLDYRFGEADANRLTALARELLQLRPDVVVASSNSAANALRQETLSVPIVFVQVPDPVGAGFVTNLARPEGNITGFTNLEPSIGGKWLQAIKDWTPQTTRVAVIFDPSNTAWPAYVRTVEAAARSFAVQLTPVSARTAADLETRINAFASSPNGALIVVPGAATTTHRKVVIALAAQHRLPAIYPYYFHTASGGLMSYGVDLASLYRGAASYVDRILRGAKPADLPIQQPTRFELAINLKTAKTLGLAVPQRLLQQADKVIE